MITEISVPDFFAGRIASPIIDVRSPGEFEKGHIPGAYNIPLFSNAERADVGTIYVQKSREEAMEVGYRYVTPKLDWFEEESRKVAGNSPVAVHCWRGGMRSRSFAEHLRDRGFSQVYLFSGGYKAYRHMVLDFFETPFRLRILGGYTGSGKTALLDILRAKGEQVIDLEDLARHKGSVFGGLGEEAQPSVEQFENNLFSAFQQLDIKAPIWIEDESHMIGRVSVPIPLYRQIREQDLYFLEIPREARARLLVEDYSAFDKQKLAGAIDSLHKRLGGDNVRLARQYLAEDQFFEVALLTLRYYDKAYLKGMAKRDPEKVFTLGLSETDPVENVKSIIQFVNQHERNQADTI